jgi:hypothetical protein
MVVKRANSPVQCIRTKKVQKVKPREERYRDPKIVVLI